MWPAIPANTDDLFNVVAFGHNLARLTPAAAAVVGGGQLLKVQELLLPATWMTYITWSH